MSKVKLVAESLQEWEIVGDLNEEQLNENAKSLLKKFVENPEEEKKAFIGAFAAQTPKVKNLKETLLKLNTETQVKLANQALKALEDPKKMYPWIKVVNGKIKGAFALAPKKSEVGTELGQ